MLYVSLNTSSVNLAVPKTTEAGGTSALPSAYSLELKNSITNAVRSLTITGFHNLRDYYLVTVTVPSDLVKGTYDYTLAKGLDVLATGVLQAGEIAPDTEGVNTTNVIREYNG